MILRDDGEKPSALAALLLLVTTMGCADHRLAKGTTGIYRL
jgi:hypothetical protein